MRRCVRDRVFLLVLVLSIRTFVQLREAMTNGEGMTKIGNQMTSCWGLDRFNILSSFVILERFLDLGRRDN